MSHPTALLRGVDRSSFAVAYAIRLRSRGVTVGFPAVEDFVLALAAAPPTTRSQLYWTARICLVRRHSDLAVFDAVFAAVFDDAVLQMDPNARRTSLDQPPKPNERHASVPKTTDDVSDGDGLPWTTLPPITADAEDSVSPLGVPERLPGALAALADAPFEQLRARDMDLLGQWLQAAVQSWPKRRTRRLAIDRAGHRIALRPTIARSRRTGWEAIDLIHALPVDRQRRVVMLCDVSQSMQAQAAAYFHLMRALALTVDAEVFAFATSLTRLTTVLTHRSAGLAIEQASAKVVDRFGGTRIATNVQSLLASHHGGAVRGAIVIVASDGWDSDRPEDLAAAMARLRRRAHCVIWMNPRASAPGFEPRVASMAAAMPFCDQLLPADTFASLARLIAQISSANVSSSAQSASSRASHGSKAGTGRR